MRFELNFETMEVKSHDLLKLENGNLELPTYNKEFEGVKENCFTYLSAMFEHQTLDENYGFDIKKLNACNETYDATAKWSTPGYLPNESHFIANPNGESEDDGLILLTAYDFNNDKSKLIVIDA
jgi:carotenoid cleavage dioxygenase-like enzyme